MKTGIFVNFGFDLEPCHSIDLIKSAGFESVMAWFGDGKEEATVSYAREQGLYVSNAHLPHEGINVMWEDGEAGEAMTEYFCSLVRLCGALKVPAAVYHVSSSFTPPPYNMLGIERIRRIVREAEMVGVDIAFENLRRLDYLQYVYDNISSERAKFCFDSGHHNYLCPDVDLFERYGDRLIAVHLHDNFGDYDWHMLPFDGKVDFERVARGLASVGYEGPVSLEVHQEVHEMYKDYTPEQYISEAYKRVVKIKEMIEKKL